MNGNRRKPYNFVEDYGLNYRFGVASDSKVSYDKQCHLFLENYFRNLFPLQKDVESSEEETSESSDQESDEYNFPEAHHCQVYSCKDPECYSCELANDCNNCGHCGINKSLQLPCFDCNTAQVHPVAQHKSVRCGYHTEFPKPYPRQFDVSRDPARVMIGKFAPISEDNSVQKKYENFLEDREKLEKYVASKVKNPEQVGTDLLQSVLNTTYSQCHIGGQLQPQVDLNTDISRFLVKPRKIAKEMRMPEIKSRPGESVANIPEVQTSSKKPALAEAKTKETIGMEEALKIENALCVGETCHCFKAGSKTCGYPKEHLISMEPCVLCEKEHQNPCICYKHRALLESRKITINDGLNALLANHSRGCLDSKCPLRSDEMARDPITKWFDTLVKLERVAFECPLNAMGFGSTEPGSCVDECAHSVEEAPSLKPGQDDKLRTYVTNYLPRSLSTSLKRDSGISQMKFWDRLNSFQETFTDHALSTHRPLITGINKPIYEDNDEAVSGKYDDVYKFWDRNKLFTPKKILVKKPETLVKLIEADDLPLQFEALHALNRSARVNNGLQENYGQKKVISPLLDVLDNCEHDGIRRQAIYILSMAVRFPPGRCVFFELGPETVKNLYKHYLTDQRYAMRRAYMLVISNLLQDTGVSAIMSSAVSFENSFANMCEKDPDLQMYLMKMLFHAMHDLVGREKIVSLPEFRLTPVLSGCLSKRSRVREVALDLLDAIVSFCKQDIVIKTFKDTRGIKVLSKILRKSYMTYAHPVVLKIYEQLADDPEAGPVMKEGSLANLVEFVDTVDDPKLIAHTLRVLVKMARDPMTKEVLALTNVITKVAPLLMHTNEELAQSVLMIIELMAAKGSRNLITQQLVKADPMVDLLWVVGSENRGWDTRVIALRCIISLINLSPFFGECYIRCKNATNVINLLCHQAKFLTTYSKTLLVQVLSALSKSERNYEFLIRNKAIKALLYSFKCFETFESQLYAHSVGLLAYMMKDRRAVIQFSNVKNSWNLLARKFMEKKFISADILMNLMFLVIDLTDNFELGAKAFMNNGFLRWMIDLEEIYPEMAGSIGNAIDSIIRNYLPLKFAHYGHLSYQDYTNRTMFFVTKDTYNVHKDRNPFPMFDKGISNKLKLEKPIYYFNLPKSMRGPSSEDIGKESLQIETSDNFDLYTTVSRSGDSVHKTSGNEEEEKFIALEDDPKLQEMFDKAKSTISMLHEESPPLNQRARRMNEVLGIAKVIQTAMMGYDPTVPVTRQIQDIYLDTLKRHLGTNVFPIGRLVMGYKFERAVLFKVFADVLDIPCWLHRNADKIAWVEVYVPPEEGYQGGELTPSFIVNLMSPEPGLILNKSPEAKAYLSNMDD